MAKARGRSHTTLTETAATVVAVLREHPAVKMIAPGHISNTGRRGARKKYITLTHTRAGLELLISGQGSQKVAVHTDADPHLLVTFLTSHKRLQQFSFKERTRKPGI